MTIPSHAVFLDPVLDERFRQDGYVVTPLLNPEEVRKLLAIDEAFMPDLAADFYTTIFHPDREHRSQVGRAIDSIVQPRVLPLLDGYRKVVSSFISKRPTTKQGKVGMHQDYTFVDQARITSVHIWIPLLDVNENNSCLWVYPGTHSLVNHIAAMPGPMNNCHPSPYDAVRTLMEKHCGVPVPMSAGSALFFNERTYHSSGENKTLSKRVVVGGAYVPEREPVYVYCPSPDKPGTLDVLTVTDFAELQLKPGQPMPYPYPEGVTKVDAVEYHIEPLEPEQILPLYHRQPPATEVERGSRVGMNDSPRSVGTSARVPNVSRLVGLLRGAKRAMFSGARP